MKKLLRNLLLIVLSLCMMIIAIPDITANASTKDNFISSFSVSKKTIYKGNGVSISLDSAKKSSSDLEITFIVKNNSKKDYAISAHEYAINNLMAGGSEYFSDVDVPKGKKARLTVKVDKSWFKENGIKVFKKFDVIFWAYYDSMKEWDSGQVSFSTNKDNKKGYYKPSKKALFSDENMSVGYVSKKNDSYKFFVQNKTDSDRDWTVDNCSVNNWSYDLGSCKYDLYSEPILSGCYAVFDLTVDNDFKKENSIKSVKKIEFNIEFESGFDNDGEHFDEIKSGNVVLKNK